MSGMHRTQIPPDPFRPLTPDELHETIRRARAEQTRAIRLIARLLARRLRRATASRRDALRSLARSYNEWRQHRQAMAALASLSDGALRDIGVTRSEIPWVARYGRSVPEKAHPRLLAAPTSPKPPALPGTEVLPPSRKRAA